MVMPSHDGIANVISRLHAEGLPENVSVNWTQRGGGRYRGARSLRSTARAARGSQRSACAGKQPAAHGQRLGRVATGLVLGQEATEEKSNEITAIPKLLEMLELKGCHRDH
jgi:hypothetical protein